MPVKLVDQSEFYDENGKITAFNRIQGNMKYGTTWYDDMQAQEKIINRLDGLLNDRYSVLRNIRVNGTDFPVPIIIIGPPGIKVLYPTSVSGFYEAKGDHWLSLDKRKNEYLPAQPNPILRCLAVKEALERFLAEHDFGIPLADPVILFSDPHIHVESQNPAVRMLPVDATNKFLMTIPDPMGKVPHYVVQLLTTELEKASDLILNPPPEPSSTGNRQLDQLGESVSKSFRFSTRQWVAIFVLVGLAAVLAIVLISLFFVY